MFLWFVGGLWVVCGRDDGYRGARWARGSRGWRTGCIGAGRGMDAGKSCRRNDRTRGRRETEGERRNPGVETTEHEDGGGKGKLGGRGRAVLPVRLFLGQAGMPALPVIIV